MENDTVNKKSFVYNGNTIYYFIKDIELIETRCKEMASAIVVICDKNSTHNDVFAIYDERYKVMYAMPDDALRWYREYIND